MDWVALLAEERIRQARRQGALDAPAWHGRRVVLPPENPHLPRTWWAAFHLLQTHDLLPPWLQRRRMLRAALAAWRQRLQRVIAARPPGHPVRRAALARLQAEAETLNRYLRDDALSRPHGAAPLPLLSWEDELARARAAVGEEVGP